MVDTGDGRVLLTGDLLVHVTRAPPAPTGLTRQPPAAGAPPCSRPTRRHPHPLSPPPLSPPAPTPPRPTPVIKRFGSRQASLLTETS
ncbi:hypothetical protein [Micromonospora sp. HM134]|uniref:hypothetical protein n=1 Tax=Micromonospora sp. HM134 TaxID=2583243 RepID=UPI001F109704|nr:hypothetical protein [Micromonospora sp. HM134]